MQGQRVATTLFGATFTSSMYRLSLNCCADQLVNSAKVFRFLVIVRANLLLSLIIHHIALITSVSRKVISKFQLMTQFMSFCNTYYIFLMLFGSSNSSIFLLTNYQLLQIWIRLLLAPILAMPWYQQQQQMLSNFAFSCSDGLRRRKICLTTFAKKLVVSVQRCRAWL